jgi:hypothetical protein
VRQTANGEAWKQEAGSTWHFRIADLLEFKFKFKFKRASNAVIHNLPPHLAEQ